MLNFFVYIFSYPFILITSLLPHSILYIISDLLSFILYRILKYRLKIVRKNILLCFPKFSKNELNLIEKKFYSHMCDVFIEMIKGLTISRNEIKKRFKFQNIELIQSFQKKSKSVVLICGHFSSWEGMLSIGLHLDYPAYGIYTPLSNKYFDKLFSKARERNKSYLLNRYKALVSIRNDFNKKKTALYGFAMDQSPRPSSKTYWKEFLGNKVPVFSGAERVSKEYGFPVVYTSINRYKRGFYSANVSLVSEFPKKTKPNEITDIFYHKLESQIKKDPSQYLWTHNRFKYLKTD